MANAVFNLGIYRGKRLLTKPFFICTVFMLAQTTEVNLSSVTITIKSNWRQILKSTYKMHHLHRRPHTDEASVAGIVDCTGVVAVGVVRSQMANEWNTHLP